jgi:hypothetical protein
VRVERRHLATRTALDAAAKKLMRAKEALKRLEVAVQQSS